jgi:HSP20 family protein
MANTLTRWEPFSDLAELRGRLDQMFADLGPRGGHHAPAIDVMRSNGDLVVRADMPGIKADEVEIKVENDMLTIKGEHEEEKEEKDSHFVRRERRWGSFERSMSLPAGVDARKITAKSHDGVLEVKVPLPKEAEGEAVTIKPTED